MLPVDARLTRALRNPWLLGAAGVLLAWLNIGVDIVGPDQQLYIPFVRHFANSAIHPGDYIFDNENYRATLFVPLVGTLHRWLGGDLVPLLLAFHFGALFLLFSGLAAATARIDRGTAPAWVVAFLSWPPPVPGAAAALWEPSPHPRTLAVALAIWALRHAADRRAVATAVLAVASAWIHPLLGGAALLGGIFAIGWDRRLMTYLATAGLMFGAARLTWGAQGTALPLAPAQWWLDVATSGFLWLARWQWPQWASLLTWSALFAVAARALRDDDAGRDDAGRRMVRFGLAAAPLFALYVIGGALRSPLLVAMQLHRGLFILIVVAVIGVGHALETARRRGDLPLALYVACAALPLTHSLVIVSGGLLATLLATTLPSLPRAAKLALAALLGLALAARVRPSQRQHVLGEPDWLALQRWAASSTSSTTRFLAPLHLPDFRVFSERASVVGVQDGQPTIFNRALAEAWQARRHAVDGYATHDCAALAAAAQRFAADDLVTDFDCPLPLVHQEGRYRVYSSAKMPSP